MFGTKQTWINFDNLKKTQFDNELESPGNYLTRLLGQSKKISQLIAYIWLNDNETSSKLDQYFRHPENLSKLLLAQPISPNEPQESEEYSLLQEVFQYNEDCLPIFDASEKDYYNFKVVYNQFEGYIADPNLGESALITMVIPYPPRPQIFDDLNNSLKSTFLDPLAKNAPLKASELKQWIEADPHNPPFYDIENPYIPTTCS